MHTATDLNALVRDILTSRVYEVAKETPLDPAPLLSARLENIVLLKREDLQPTFSFKVRGAYNRMARLSDGERARGVVAASAGNHAQGVALAAARLGVRATIVMPRTTPEIKVDAVRALGAEVSLVGDQYAEAQRHAEQIAQESGRVFVHPFDDPLVIAGQGTVGLELLEDAPEVETVLVATGGGGLVSGVAAAIGGRVQVVAVEPELSTAVHTGLAAGHSVPVSPASIADGLSAPFAGELALATLREQRATSVLVGEEAIEDAFRWLYERAKLACEPAAATALAPLLTGQVEPRKVGVVVSGGNVSAQIASGILTRR